MKLHIEPFYKEEYELKTTDAVMNTRQLHKLLLESPANWVIMPGMLLVKMGDGYNVPVSLTN